LGGDILMITGNIKDIFNKAAKKNEKFVRDAISVFPKAELKQVENKKNKKEKYVNYKKV
jgi:hypothetical protein